MGAGRVEVKTKRSVAVSLIALALCGAGVSAWAAEVRLVPDRPDRANSADTIPPGLAQIETGMTFLRDASGERPSRRLTAEGVLRLGLAQTLEFSIGGDLFVRERSEGQGTSGLGDTRLAGKWRLVDDEGWRPALGVFPFVKLPTASRGKGLGSGRMDFGGTLAASKDLPGDLHVDVNVGLAAITLAEAPGGLFLQRTTDVSFSWALTDRISPFWEIFYESRDRPTGRHSVGTDFGLIFTLHERVAIDVAGEVGLLGNAADWAVRAGFTVLLGAFRNPDPQAARRGPGPRAVGATIDTRGWSAYHPTQVSPVGGGVRP